MRPLAPCTARLGAALLLWAALPAPAPAQFGGTMDLHTGPVTWDQADDGDPLLDGKISAGYRLGNFSWLTPELLGDFGVMSGPSQPAAVRWELGARLHAAGESGGVWAGFAFGAAGVGSPQRSLARWEGGVRRSFGAARIDVWLSSTGFGAGTSSLGQDTAQPDTLGRKGFADYTDLGSQLRFDLSRYQLGLSLTRRLGSEVIRRTGWELSATWWMAPRVGLVGAIGHSLPQLGFVVPGGRYGTVGLRLALGAGPRVEHGRTGEIETRVSNAPTLLIQRRRLTLRSAPARRAEVIGDFTDWKPLPLESTGAGRWTLPLELAPGVHHLNVRFDGGPWLVPAGAFAVDDGFGGRVGLVVVR